MTKFSSRHGGITPPRRDFLKAVRQSAMRSAVASWRRMLCPRRDSVRDSADVPVANKGPFHSHLAP
jgi:hypothetical protein